MKDTIKEFVSTTSIHGIPHTNDRRPVWLRVLWALLSLGGFSIALWQIIMVGLEFRKSPFNVLFDITHSSNIPFPAVTICNANQLRKSHLYESSSPAAEKLKAAILEHQQHFKNRSLEHSIENSTCVTNSTSYDEMAACLWARLESNKTGLSPAASIQVNDHLNDALKAMHVSEKEPMGHTIEGMLLDCSFEGAFCSPRDFQRFYDTFKYGNCFTFNGVDKNAPSTDIRSTTKPGKEHGLHLELFLEDDEYIPELSPSLGIRLVIHDQNEIPFPTGNGFFVSPGFDSSVALKKVTYDRLGSPWYDCIAPCSTDFNVYQDRANCSYSLGVCFHTWLQKHVMELCHCKSPYIPSVGLPGEDSLESCDIHNETQEDCLEDTEYNFGIGMLESNCSPPCTETKFDTRISTSLWPTSGYEDILQEKYVSHATPKILSLLHNSTSDLRNHILKVDIFYQELNYERMYQEAAYTWLTLIGDLGGQLGLWIGISILSVIEIMEFLINILISLLGTIKGANHKKLQSQKDNSDVTPVEEFKMNGEFSTDFQPSPWPETFIRHHADAGRTQSEMLVMAKCALTFFEDQFGMCFDNLSDRAIISGEKVTDAPQGLLFSPGILPKCGKLRLDVAISAGGSKWYKVISDAGWSVAVTKPYTSTGKFVGTLQPGWSVVYGDYVISSNDQSKPLVITYKSKCPLGTVELSTSKDTFSYRVELFSELFGKGVGQVTCTDVPPKTFTTAVMTFPPILEIDK